MNTKERVSNEEAHNIRARYNHLSETIKLFGMAKQVHDLAADLLDARKERDEAMAMVREMRAFINGLQLDGVSDDIKREAIMDRTKEYADERD